MLAAFASTSRGEISGASVTGMACDMFGVEDREWSGSSYLLFTPFDQHLPLVDFWTLEWHGLIVPIPRVKYVSLLINGDGETSNTVILGSENSGMLVYLLRDIHEAIVYQRDENRSEQPPDLSISYMTLLENAYSSSPADIDCGSEDWATQVPIIAALVAKELGVYGRKNRVYKSVGQTAGILVQSEFDNVTKIEYTGVESDFEEQILQVGYRAKIDSGVGEFGLLISKDVLDPVDSPEWVTKMSEYLREWDLVGLKSLSEEQGWKFLDARPAINEKSIREMLSKPEVKKLLEKQMN